MLNEQSLFLLLIMPGLLIFTMPAGWLKSTIKTRISGMDNVDFYYANKSKPEYYNRFCCKIWLLQG